MELHICSSQQLGLGQYYYPMTVNKCGVVDHEHTYPDINVGAHLHAHLDHKKERFDKKGANDVMSVLVQTLKDRNMLRENDVGGELNLVFDNCTGQNKNNTILNLLVYLTEAGFFTKITFVFLIVGHTKNSADNLSHGDSRCCKE